MKPQNREDVVRLLLHTVLCVLLMLFITTVVVQLLVRHYELPIGDAAGAFDSVTRRQQLRFVLLINNLGLFCISAVLALYLTYKGRWTVAAGLVRPPRPGLIPFALATFVLALPLIALATYANLQVDLPEWMNTSEAAGNRLLAGVLTFDTAPELLLALLMAAVVPAFGEELLFRGLLQGRLLRQVMSGHASIWVAAAIFSAIHVEFAGFLPRLLLGALLGYTYRWSGSLWIPILLHFLFNGIQVLTTYVSGEFTPDTEIDAALSTLLLGGTVSLLLVSWMVWTAERKLRSYDKAND